MKVIATFTIKNDQWGTDKAGYMFTKPENLYKYVNIGAYLKRKFYEVSVFIFLWIK